MQKITTIKDPEGVKHRKSSFAEEDGANSCMGKAEQERAAAERPEGKVMDCLRPGDERDANPGLPRQAGWPDARRLAAGCSETQSKSTARGVPVQSRA